MSEPMTLRERVGEALYGLCKVGERKWEDAPTQTRQTLFDAADVALAVVAQWLREQAELPCFGKFGRNAIITVATDAIEGK